MLWYNHIYTKCPNIGMVFWATVFLLQVWFLSFFFIFLIYLDTFSRVFGYIINLIAMCTCFRPPKQCVAHCFRSRYGFYHFLLFFWCILMCFQCIFYYIICLVAICSHFQPPKQCVAHFFCSRYGFCHLLLFFWHILMHFQCVFGYIINLVAMCPPFSIPKTMCSISFWLWIWFYLFYIGISTNFQCVLGTQHTLLLCPLISNPTEAKTMYCMLFWLQVLVAVPLVSNLNEAKTMCCTFFSSFNPNEAALALFFFLLSCVSCYLTPTLLLFPTWMGPKQPGSRHVFIFFYVFYIWHPPCRHAPHFQPKWGHFSSFFLLHSPCSHACVSNLNLNGGKQSLFWLQVWFFFLFDASVA